MRTRTAIKITEDSTTAHLCRTQRCKKHLCNIMQCFFPEANLEKPLVTLLLPSCKRCQVGRGPREMHPPSSTPGGASYWQRSRLLGRAQGFNLVQPDDNGTPLELCRPHDHAISRTQAQPWRATSRSQFTSVVQLRIA